LFSAPIWLPAGLAATAAMLGGARLLPGIFLGSLLVNALVFDAALPEAAAISLGNAMGPLAGALLSRRLRPATGLFTRFHGVVAFILGIVLLHALVTATIGTLSLVWLGRLPWDAAGGNWASWLLCEASGTFYFAPSLALWLGLERTPSASGTAPLGRRWRATACCWTAPSGWPPPGSPCWCSRWNCAAAVRAAGVPAGGAAVLDCAAHLAARHLHAADADLRDRLGRHGGGAGAVPEADAANPMQSTSMLVVLCAMNILTLLGAVAERLRIALHEVRPGFPLPDGRLAASFGVAIRQPGEGLSTLLLRADDALYEAKHNGRDQVRLAEPAASPRHAAAG
jgi:GGDEF domain-containing protein